MKVLYDLKDMLCESLMPIVSKGDINANELERVYKAVDVIKDIDTIEAMHGGSYEGNSYLDGYEGGNSRRGGGSYGNSNRRDSRGRYTSRDGGSYRYSRTSMKEHLQAMMEEAQTEKEREAIRECMMRID